MIEKVGVYTEFNDALDVSITATAGEGTVYLDDQEHGITGDLSVEPGWVHVASGYVKQRSFPAARVREIVWSPGSDR